MDLGSTSNKKGSWVIGIISERKEWKVEENNNWGII